MSSLVCIFIPQGQWRDGCYQETGNAVRKIRLNVLRYSPIFIRVGDDKIYHIDMCYFLKYRIQIVLWEPPKILGPQNVNMTSHMVSDGKYVHDDSHSTLGILIFSMITVPLLTKRNMFEYLDLVDIQEEVFEHEIEPPSSSATLDIVS